MNIYDFDKTIYETDASIDFFLYLIRIKKWLIIYIPKICFYYLLYLLKIIKKEKLKEVFFDIIKYFNNVEKLVKDFWDGKNYKLKDFYMKQKRKDDIIVSASPEFLIKPVSEKYGFKLLATNYDIKARKIIGNNCYGKEKVRRLKKIGITKCFKAFSDSKSDYPMLSIADKAYMVKGNKLIEIEIK